MTPNEALSALLQCYFRHFVAWRPVEDHSVGIAVKYEVEPAKAMSFQHFVRVAVFANHVNMTYEVRKKGDRFALFTVPTILHIHRDSHRVEFASHVNFGFNELPSPIPTFFTRQYKEAREFCDVIRDSKDDALVRVPAADWLDVLGRVANAHVDLHSFVPAQTSTSPWLDYLDAWYQERRASGKVTDLKFTVDEEYFRSIEKTPEYDAAKERTARAIYRTVTDQVEMVDVTDQPL